MADEIEGDIDVADTLHPDIAVVDGSCYRVNAILDKKPSTSSCSYRNDKRPYNDNETDEELECVEKDIDLVVTEDLMFKTTLRMPKTFFSYVIGTKGSRRKKIEQETKTQIIVPKQNGKITITGRTERSIIDARNRLETIAQELRSRHGITHFVSFPLISDEIKANFKKFKELVLAEDNIRGMDNSIFQKVDKLHVTVGTMVLLDESERDEAADVLESFRTEVLPNLLSSRKPLIIKMKGLEYMNDDPSQVDVLYSKVAVNNHENSDILQKLSDEIVNYFYSKGLMKRETAHVKLHATVINTRYRRDSDGSGSRSRDRKFKRIAFDARNVLQKFGDFDFGEQELNSIHLSHRFSVDANGYYEAVHAISCV